MSLVTNAKHKVHPLIVAAGDGSDIIFDVLFCCLFVPSVL